MEIVTGAMSTLLPKLGTLLTDEYKLQKGVKGDIIYLKAELESMQAALERVSRVPADQLDKQAKIWARQVRELSYDIEDSIDTFMVRIDAGQPTDVHFFRRFIDMISGWLRKAKAGRQIAKDTLDIKSHAQEVAERHERYNKLCYDNPLVCSNTAVDPRIRGMYREATELVGIDGPTEHLEKLLMEEDSAPKVIAIVGAGGLGKTTLAYSLRRKLEGKFRCEAFVLVSQKPDQKNILASILRQVSGQEYPNTVSWPVTEIIDKIRKFLQDKRYFIIVDDIWDSESWELISCAFTKNNCSSRVIVTTRKVDVGKSCRLDSHGTTIYELPPLSVDDSKKLFHTRIFDNVDGCPPELKDISKRILKKCGGLPLAIITIASLLASKKTYSQWCDVHNSIGSGLETRSAVDSIRSILSLSYYDMPSHLKSCLLYLCMFPEDYKIERNDLILNWICEGFVHRRQDDDDLYEVGERYFTELINRSMIMPVGMDYNGRAKACRVHDMVLDLIISLSAEENFVTILGSEQSSTLPDKIRRMSLQSGKNANVITQAAKRWSHARSLTIFHDGVDSMSPLSSPQFLRVLDVHTWAIPKGIEDVEKLLHLRHLRLRGYGTELPKEIGNLRFLQTLDIRKCQMTELPSSIAQLRQLVRLFVNSVVKLPKGIGSIKSLQELSHVRADVSPDLLGELGNLTNLRVLEINAWGWHGSHEKIIAQCISNMSRLRVLQISIHSADFSLVPQHFQKFRSFGSFSTLPGCISSLSYLSYLEIKLKTLTLKDIKMLGELSSLRFLHLDGYEHLDWYEAPKERLVIGTGAFQCLTELSLFHAMGLMFTPGSAQRLQRLVLTRFAVRNTIDKFGGVDIGIRNLTSLKCVTVWINCYTATPREVKDTEAMIRNACGTLPNRPSPEITRCHEKHMWTNGELKAYKEKQDGIKKRRVRRSRRRAKRQIKFEAASINNIGCLEDTEAMIRNACGTLRNRPSPEIRRCHEKYMWTNEEPNEELKAYKEKEDGLKERRMKRRRAKRYEFINTSKNGLAGTNSSFL